MSKSVEQINALITKTVRSARTEKEVSLKGLTFGRWLNNVGEYEKAAKWLVKYLAANDKDAKAHRLLGEIYEKIDDTEAALSCYKNSLRVKQQQYDLMLKVAEMHINPGPGQNPGLAEVWLDKAAAARPNSPQVYKLKMELHLAKEEPSSKLEDTILEELKKRPGDPSLHVQYVSFLKDQERLEDAFEYVQKAAHTLDLPIVDNDLDWNQCLIDTCQEYSELTCDDEVTAEGIKAYSLLLISICRYVWLAFEQEKYDDAIENLAMLDTTVFSALSLTQESGQGDAKTEWDAIINESKGQMYWLSGIALIHLATKDIISWSEGTKLSAVCFTASLSFPVADVTETWASWSKDSCFSTKLKIMGGFRLSQSAHMLYNLSSVSHTAHKEEDDINERTWMKEVTDNFCTNEGSKRIFIELFGDQYNPETSMICSDPLGSLCVRHIPEETLNDYDTIAALGNNLQTWIWMGLQWRQNFDNDLDPFEWVKSVFPDLQFSSGSSAKYGNVWNLTHLDVESFVVGCVLYAEKAASLWDSTKPETEEDTLGLSRLPLPLCRKLTTKPQSEWWQSACLLHCRKEKEKIFNANQIRATLRHGVETIRGSGNHGLQVTLVVNLAKHFAAKAYTIEKSTGTSSGAWLTYQQRAARYWTIALPTLQDAAINRTKQKTQPVDRLFPYTLNEPTMQEANSLISEVYMCNGKLLAQEGDVRRALDAYGKADTPQASFCEAMIYKQLLETCEKNGNSIIGSGNKKREAHMKKYTVRLQITLNRLERDPDDELRHRVEELLQQQVSTSPSMIRYREMDQKQLLQETITKRSPLAGNHTVISEVDETFAIPSKQSTPKGETRPVLVQNASSDSATMRELVKTLSTLVSMMQVQMNEKSAKEERKSPMPSMGTMPSANVQSQLEKITSIVSGLQEKKDEEDEEKRQLRSEIEALKEQLSQTQLGTQTAPTRVVQLTQQDGIPPGSPLQVFEQYQQASLGQIHSPIPPVNQYIGSPYHGYVQQNPAAMAALYAQRAYGVPQGLPTAYGQNRMPQQIIDPRAIPSPARTPPAYARPQTPSKVGLPMSREAADALSVRFQAAMTGSASAGPAMAPSPGMQHPPMPGARSMGSSAAQSAMVGMHGFDLTGTQGVQSRLPHIQSEPVLGGSQSMFANISLGHPQAPQPPPLVQRPVPQQSLNESYIPTTNANLVQPPQGTSMLKSLLASGQSQATAIQSAQPEIRYPDHFSFPQSQDQQSTTVSSAWSFKFQSPEDIDRDNKKLEADEEAEDAETSHNETGPHFEPLVTLPEVEVRTGEEDEEAVFSDRAKLYRWHEGQWKERGLGTMKILKHKETGKYRLLMRRDQIHKVCCNHLIGQSMDLQPMPKSDKSLIWHAMDFSEDAGKQECFAIRFKTTEITDQFKERFLEGRAVNSKISGDTPVEQPVQPEIKVTSTPRTTASNFPATVMQDPEKMTSTPQTVASVSSVLQTPVTVSQPNPPQQTQSSVSGTLMPKFNFSFQNSSPAAVALAARIAGTPPKQEPEKEDESNDEENEDVHNETGDGPQFEPIIKLPDKVETKTGEEDEEVLFCQRAKLYRYVDKQWKERGLGDIKILHNTQTKKCRVVMRREQVLKLCANHYISVDMSLARMANSDKTWTWTAMDHSEPDSQPRQEFFAARFQSPEKAAEFAEVFGRAKDITAETEVAAPKGSDDSSATSDATSTPSVPTSAPSQPPPQVQQTKGVLVAKKESGSWNCPLCYSPNLATDSTCPCCSAPNPNATKEDTSKPSSLTTQSAPKFSFGIPAGSKPSTTYSFGIPSNAQPNKPPATAPSGLFQTASATFGLPQQSAQPTKPVQETGPSSVFGPVNQMLTSGPLKVDKKPGKWSCSACYAENEATDSACPCCNTPNPNAPKGEVTGAKPGIFSSANNTGKTAFSFGLPSGTTQPTGNVTSTSKFGFGNQSGGTQFQSELDPTFGGSMNVNNSSISQPSQLFSNLGSSIPKPNIFTADASKPRFPSVGGEEEEDESEDEDGEYETDDQSSEDDEDYSTREERYRSPMNRLENQNPAVDDGDVICLGEILPNEELQRKAESLMLPKHFYNFVKQGEVDTEGGSESEPEQPMKAPTETTDGKAADANNVTTAPSTTSVPANSTFGFGSATSGFSFADLTQSNTSGGFAFGGNKSGGWVGMGEQKPLFANSTQHDTSHDGEECPENEADNIHFEPVINLPDEVEAVTGEEDEETLYSQRCKLYRYNKPTNEWKERGLGDIKFLKHKTTGKIRIVMRREQVLKVCANHYLRLGMTLDPNKSSDRAWSWSAMDHTDEDDPKFELFTARFKSVEIANEFKEKFEMCQTLLLDAAPMTPCQASSSRNEELAKYAEQMKDELQYFKVKFSEPLKVDLQNTVTDVSNFEPKPTSPVGSLSTLVAQHKESLRQSAAENTAEESIFETPQKPKSLVQDDNKFSFAVNTSSDDPQVENEIHFEPVVQLPEKVELVTGEEDEQVVFANRAKLYAFHKEKKEWKERGLGDVKILQHLSNFNARVIMRREQVLKVCLNHLVKQEYKLSFKEANDGKTLLWTARDYSDPDVPDGEDLQFALRFKNHEIASSFKELWNASVEAASSNTLLEPDPSDINTSMVKAGVTSPGPVVQSPQSPESPVKQPTSTFSFANLPSPFDSNKVSSEEGPVEVMGFVFGKPDKLQSASTQNTPFKFDTSKFSFSFTGTSTPDANGFTTAPQTGFFTAPGTLPGLKPEVSKTLFPAESDAEESNSAASANSTFAQSAQSSEDQTSECKDGTSNTEAKPSLLDKPTGKEYKPSPLAVASSGSSNTTSAFSQQSGKFQFKPPATETSQQKVTERLVPAFQVRDYDDDDVIFVSELQPTEDQRQRAEKLMLPPTFYLYENKPTPPGFSEQEENEKEEKVLKFIEDRNSGRIEIKQDKVETPKSPASGDTVDAGVKPSDGNNDARVFGAGIQQTQQTFGSLGSNSFASLASNVGNLGFKTDPSFQFPGAGTTIFRTQVSNEDNSDQHPSDYKCDAQFKPVLEKPPPLVEAKTGEEGEEILFKDRCKLYRYDTNEKAWKEKGVGEIKILRNDEHKFYRVLMRRDQVLKVCTNHVINETTKPEFHLGSTKTCSYFVMDYSETIPPTPEQIAIRFKNDEICKAYMDKVAEIKDTQESQS